MQIFLRSLIIGYSGAMMPGSLLTYTINKSMKHGAKSGILISIGHSILELFLVVILFVGLGKYLAADPVQTVIALVGGAVLIFFGFGMLRDVYRKKISINFAEMGSAGQGSMIVEGAIISATNPYFIFWWAAVGLGLIVDAYNVLGILGIVLFYLGHICSDITWYSFISVLISKTRKFMNLTVYTVTIAVLGLFLIGFGLKFIYSGFNMTMKLF
jgi:threonine/homoserine/homoserine lactone efflux protein